MPERKCDFPLIVEMSNGRANCPDVFYNAYKINSRCQFCPKVATNRLKASNFETEGEKEASRFRREVRQQASLGYLKEV